MRLQRFCNINPANAFGSSTPLPMAAQAIFIQWDPTAPFPCMAYSVTKKVADLRSLPPPPHTGESPGVFPLSLLTRPAAFLFPSPCQSTPLPLPPYQAGVKHHPCRHRQSYKHTCSRGAAHHLAFLASYCTSASANALRRLLCCSRLTSGSRCYCCCEPSA